MRSRSVVWALMMLGIAGSAMAGTSVSVGIDISNAPPPPVVVYREEPRTILVPNTTVWVVEDRRASFDLFRYGVYWYVYDNGYWYRGRSHRGPFKVVAVKYVPRAIMNVPAHHWKHHPHGGPPGQTKDQRSAVVVKEKGRGKNR